MMQFPVAWFTGAAAATGVSVHAAPAPAAVSFALTMTTQASGAPRAHEKPRRRRTPTAGCRTTAAPTPVMRRVAGRGGVTHLEGTGGRGGGDEDSEALAAGVPVTEPVREALGEAACEADTEGVPLPLGDGVSVAVAAPDALGVPVPVSEFRDDATTDGVKDALGVRLWLTDKVWGVGLPLGDEDCTCESLCVSDGDCVSVGVTEGEEVTACERDDETLRLGTWLGVAWPVGDPLPVKVGVAISVGVPEGDSVPEAEAASAGVLLCVPEDDNVAFCDGVDDALGVAMLLEDWVTLGLCDPVGDGVIELDGVRDLDIVCVVLGDRVTVAEPVRLGVDVLLDEEPWEPLWLCVSVVETDCVWEAVATKLEVCEDDDVRVKLAV